MANLSSQIPAVRALDGEFIQRPYKKVSVSEKGESQSSIALPAAKWRKLIGLISEGVGTLEAIEQTGVLKFALEGKIRTDEKAKSEWEDAKTAALWRNWDLETLENILAHVASGGSVRAGLNKYAIEEFKSAEIQFYKLLLRDAHFKEMYDEARMVQAEKMAIDDLLEISDNDDNDLTVDGRPNSAAVNRSRLKVQSRQWIAARLHYKRFGEKQQVDLNAHIIVDHAARLEEARRRKEDLLKKPKPGEEV